MTFSIQFIPTLGYMKSFAVFYLLCLIDCILFVWMEFFVKPRTQDVEFSQSDPSISKSFKPNELVGNGLCLFISAGLSIIIITGYCVYAKPLLKNCKKLKDVKKELHLWHTSLLALFFVLTTNGLITCFLKVVIGNLRPDFLDRCQLDPMRTENRFKIQDCLQKDTYTLYDGLRSTPSGHASFAVSGLGFLYLWQYTFTTGDSRGYLWCPVLAVLVMISRVLDHKHHWYDLILGSLVGSASILLSWNWLVKRHLLRSEAWQLPRPITA